MSEDKQYEIEELQKLSPTEIFTNDELIDSLLKGLEQKVRLDFSDDVSTAKSRSYSIGLASKIRKTKTFIDGRGKDLVDELKALPKLIDANRKKVRDTLDSLAEEARRPVTEWEEAKAEIERQEQARKTAIENITKVPATMMGLSSKEIERALSYQTAPTDLFYGPFIDEAIEAYNTAMESCGKILQTAKDAEEAAELRREKEQRDREDQIRKEAEETAARNAALANEAREADAKKAIREKEEADLRAANAEKNAKAQADAAAEAARNEEREAMAAISRARDLDQRKAMENHALKLQIAAEIVTALGRIGIEDPQARRISKAIFRGEIPHVTINYTVEQK